MLNDQTTPTAPDTDDAVAVEAPAAAQDTASAAQLEQLLVLSQSPLSLEDALQQEAERTDDDAPVQLTAGRLLKQYAGLLALFLGVGLITAAVRHYADAPKLYLGAVIGGGVLFAVGSVALDPRSRRGGTASLLRFGALSALLGIGFGLLVGGVLHFSAFPHTGAVLVPLGLALSIGTFIARDGRALVGRDLMSAGVTVAGLLVWLGVGLGFLAKKIDPAPAPAAPHGAVSAGHGSAAAGHGAAAAGGHGEAAAADASHGAAAEGDHGAAAAAGDHGAAAAAHGEAKTAAADHGDTAAKAEHGTATQGEHGAAAKSDHGAADHGAAATADHGVEAKTDHGAAADAGHGAAAKSDHGTADAHGATTTRKSHAAEEEDEVNASDVLVPRKGENLKKH